MHTCRQCLPIGLQAGRRCRTWRRYKLGREERQDARWPGSALPAADTDSGPGSLQRAISDPSPAASWLMMSLISLTETSIRRSSSVVSATVASSAGRREVGITRTRPEGRPASRDFMPETVEEKLLCYAESSS